MERGPRYEVDKVHSVVNERLTKYYQSVKSYEK